MIWGRLGRFLFGALSTGEEEVQDLLVSNDFGRFLRAFALSIVRWTTATVDLAYRLPCYSCAISVQATVASIPMRRSLNGDRRDERAIDI